MNHHIKPQDILGLDSLATTQWLSLWCLHYNHQNQERHWVFASRHADKAVVLDYIKNGRVQADAVSIVAFVPTEQGYSLVVTREFRPAVGYEYSFPAGLIDRGERAPAALERELHEETGLELSLTLLESPPVYSSAGMTDECLHIIFCIAEGEATNAHVTAGEDIEVLLLPLHELRDLCHSRGKYAGAIHGARSWAIMMMLSVFSQLHTSEEIVDAILTEDQ